MRRTDTETEMLLLINGKIQYLNNTIEELRHKKAAAGVEPPEQSYFPYQHRLIRTALTDALG